MAHVINTESLRDKQLQCFVCCKKQAHVRTTIVDHLVEINLCVCPECEALGARRILTALKIKPTTIPYFLLGKWGRNRRTPFKFSAQTRKTHNRPPVPNGKPE